MMKLTVQRLIGLFVLAIYFCAPIGAQKKNPGKQPATESAAAEARSLRTQQLLILHENLLSRTLDSIKKIDEGALRLSVRIQLLAYLWESKRSRASTSVLKGTWRSTQLRTSTIIIAKCHNSCGIIC
jgi:hypothetical protein